MQKCLRADEKAYAWDDYRPELRKPRDEVRIYRLIVRIQNTGIPDHGGNGVTRRQHHADVLVAETSVIQGSNDVVDGRVLRVSRVDGRGCHVGGTPKSRITKIVRKQGPSQPYA